MDAQRKGARLLRTDRRSSLVARKKQIKAVLQSQGNQEKKRGQGDLNSLWKGENERIAGGVEGKN